MLFFEMRDRIWNLEDALEIDRTAIGISKPYKIPIMKELQNLQERVLRIEQFLGIWTSEAQVDLSKKLFEIEQRLRKIEKAVYTGEIIKAPEEEKLEAIRAEAIQPEPSQLEVTVSEPKKGKALKAEAPIEEELVQDAVSGVDPTAECEKLPSKIFYAPPKQDIDEKFSDIAKAHLQHQIHPEGLETPAAPTKPATSEAPAVDTTSMEPRALTTASVISDWEQTSVKTTDDYQKTYSENASKLEMDLAANWLNVAGIILLVAGVILFLRQAIQSVHSGIPQVIVGSLVGIGLIALGDYFHRKDMKGLGHSLISGGFCILLFVVAASYFYFHLIRNPAALAMLIFFIVTSSGVSIFRYDSKIIANVVLLITYTAPFIMTFKLENPTILFVYLIAINLGVAFVAYYKKWDYYIMVSFLMTYIHYFMNYSLVKSNFATMLIFLTVFYLIFLISNNLIHFKLKIPGGYNLFVSYFNPLLFGCISYYLFTKSPNWLTMKDNPNLWALILYSALGYIHLYLAKQSNLLEDFDKRFSDITKNNLVLGLMFVTAAVSFVTYFTDTDKYFSVVTALWFIQAFALLIYSFKNEFYQRIIRRFSYLTLIIIWAQMVSVISWMPQHAGWEAFHKYSIYFTSVALFYAYFHIMYKNEIRLEKEDWWMMALSLMSCFAIIIYLTYMLLHIYTLFLISVAAAYIMLLVSFKLKVQPEFFRYISYFVSIFIAIAILLYEVSYTPNPQVAGLKLTLYPLITLIYCLIFYTLYKHKDKIHPSEDFMFGVSVIMPAVIVGILAFKPLNPFGKMAVTAFLSNLILFMCSRFPQQIRGMKTVFYAVAVILTLIITFWPHEKLNVMFLNYRFLCIVFIAFLFFNAWYIIKKHASDLADSKGHYQIFIFFLISILLMKAFLMETAGMVSTFIWSIFGIAALYIGFNLLKDNAFKGLAHFILFITMMKALVYDSTSQMVYSSYTFGLVLQMSAMILLITAIYYVASRKMSDDPVTRDVFQTYGLIIFSFLVSALLFRIFGVLDNFQIILTIFWCSISILYIILGIAVGRKIFRLFGLVLLIASVAKIIFVDLWVLKFFDMIPPFFITGCVLIAVSFLYQKNKARLMGKGGQSPNIPSIPAPADERTQ